MKREFTFWELHELPFSHDLFFKFDYELAEDWLLDPAIIEIGFLLFFIVQKLIEVAEPEAFEWHESLLKHVPKSSNKY